VQEADDFKDRGFDAGEDVKEEMVKLFKMTNLINDSDDEQRSVESAGARAKRLAEELEKLVREK
jgi:hypothetical protein